MSHDLPDDWYIEPTGESLILDQEKVAAEIERLLAREDALLRAAIDATWGEALEDGSVPATKKQDWIIAYARARVNEQSMRETK